MANQFIVLFVACMAAAALAGPISGDKIENCEDLKEYGYCLIPKIKDFMKKNCAKTCEFAAEEAEGADGAEGAEGAEGADGADGADGNDDNDGNNGADEANGADGAGGAGGSSEGECEKEERDDCDMLKKDLGYCDLYKSWMAEKCCKTCGSENGTDADGANGNGNETGNGNDNEGGNGGEEGNGAEGSEEGSEGTGNEGSDEGEGASKEVCGGLKQLGFCKNHKDWMTENCKDTC